MTYSLLNNSSAHKYVFYIRGSGKLYIPAHIFSSIFTRRHLSILRRVTNDSFIPLKYFKFVTGELPFRVVNLDIINQYLISIGSEPIKVEEIIKAGESIRKYREKLFAPEIKLVLAPAKKKDTANEEEVKN
jgi:hypothetical protein